jgi:N utilization substance protein B
MSNRHLSRSIALQTLFEFDVRDGFSLYDETAITKTISSNVLEFAPGLNSPLFSEYLVKGVIAKIKTLDDVLTKAAPDWAIDKIPNVDRNILRLGLFELIFGNYAEVPPKVAIDEAIELGKMFGGEATARFINGVLGRVYKELGEPGKKEAEEKALAKTKTVSPDIKVQKLAGAVVYSKNPEGEIFLALVHDIFGHWTLSKGKLGDEEGLEEGTKRSVKEELGIAVEIVDTLGENSYISSHPQFKKIKKEVTYFLAKSEYTPILFEIKGGLDDAAWFPLKDLEKLSIYQDVLPIITKAVSKLQK